MLYQHIYIKIRVNNQHKYKNITVLFEHFMLKYTVLFEHLQIQIKLILKTGGFSEENNRLFFTRMED